MADFTKEIVILAEIRDRVIEAGEIFEAAKQLEPMVAEIDQLKLSKASYEAETETAKQRAYETKKEVGQQLVEFRKQADDETTALYDVLNKRKLEVESAVAKLDRAQKDAEDRLDGVIATREAQLTRINEQIATAEALRDKLKEV